MERCTFAIFYCVTFTNRRMRVKLVKKCIKFTPTMLYKNAGAITDPKNLMLHLLICYSIRRVYWGRRRQNNEFHHFKLRLHNTKGSKNTEDHFKRFSIPPRKTWIRKQVSHSCDMQLKVEKTTFFEKTDWGSGLFMEHKRSWSRLKFLKNFKSTTSSKKN